MPRKSTPATQKRYIDCQRNPNHVFNNGQVELTIGQETYDGVTIQATDGTAKLFLTAHIHRGNLVVEVTTPDNQPATAFGTQFRKLLIEQPLEPSKDFVVT
jgi:hypothetical protein